MNKIFGIMVLQSEDKTRYINKLEKHIEQAKDSAKYSLDRFDILIISLSTCSLIFSIGFVKDIIPNLNDINTTLLKLAWLFFLISLIANLISQVSGYYANKYDIKITQNIIREKRNKKMKGNQNLYKQICKYLNYATIWLNGLSLILLISGLIALIVFFHKYI